MTSYCLQRDLQTLKTRQTDQMAVTVAVSVKTPKRQFLSLITLSVPKERKKRKPG